MPAEARTRIRPSARPRHRYVLFEVAAPRPPSRWEFLRALRAADATVGSEGGPTLTRFDGRHGVLRVTRGGEGALRRLLQDGLRGSGMDARPISTSGTLAALERRFPLLRLARRSD